MGAYRESQYMRKFNGKKYQEIIAVMLEKYFPNPKYAIFSWDTHGPDIEITNRDTQKRLTGEVKTCTELFYHGYSKIWRRGMFKMCINQLNVDFYVFIIKFCEGLQEGYRENGDYEFYFVQPELVRSYFSGLSIKNCKEEFALGIAKLHTCLGATQDIDLFLSKLPKI